MRIVLRFVLIIAALLAVPAQAVLRIATYTGHVLSAYDVTGVFGAANTDLTGRSYTAKYYYDTSLGVRDGDGIIYEQTRGGPTFGASSPITFATLTISGITQNFGSQVLSSGILIANNQVRHFINDFINDNERVLNNAIVSSTDLQFLFGSLDLTLPPQTGSSTFGYFQIYSDNFQNPSLAFANGYLDNGPSSSIVEISSIPEPAEWALLILGFAIVGLTMRYQSRLAIRERDLRRASYPDDQTAS